MVTEFRFPDVGEGITEGTVKRWLVKEGDHVEEDQVLAEVETDKAVVEMPAPASGSVLRIYIQEDEVVKVGQVLVVIGQPGEEAPAPGAVAPAPVPTAAPPAPKVTAAPATAPVASPAAPQVPTAPTGAAGGKVRATPKVRRLAKERGVDLSAVAPTGSGGRVTEADVERTAAAMAASAQSAAAKPAMKVKLNYDFYGHIKHRPFKGLRKVIAENMERSRYTAPHATAMEEVDVTALWDLRKVMQDKAKEEGVHLTFLPFIVMATVKALQRHEGLNSTLDEEEADIIVKEYYNIGIAVDTDDGLMVPVLKRAEHKDVWQIAREIEDLTAKARSRKIDLAELKGGTFTISNYGSVGGMYGVPIINFPEAAILGVGRIREVPRVVDGKVKARRVVGLSVSFDHRIVDGAEVAGFINTLKELFEEPELIMKREESEG